MNHLKTMVIENLEGNKYITHMDLRDNQLTDLDLSSLCNLEQLHCERNQLRELTLSGFSLRTLYANSNSEFSTQSPVFPLVALVQAFQEQWHLGCSSDTLRSGVWGSLRPSFKFAVNTSVVEICIKRHCRTIWDSLSEHNNKRHSAKWQEVRRVGKHVQKRVSVMV